MSREARELIERAEREAGGRIDDSDNQTAMAILVGALSRELRDAGLDSSTPPSYTERDDCAAGMMILHQMSPAGQQELEGKEMLANMLRSGVSPDDLGKLFGR